MALGFDIVRGKDFNLGVNLTYNYNKNNIDELMDGVLADTRAMNDWGSSMAKPKANSTPLFEVLPTFWN